MSQTGKSPDSELSVCQLVVARVADEKGVAPDELAAPLYEILDPDALERLVSGWSSDGRSDGQITFAYDGCEVTVRGDGSVSVERRDA